MNNKVSRMLRQMMATESDLEIWRSLSPVTKGRLRHFHENYEKLAPISFESALEQVRIRFGNDG